MHVRKLLIAVTCCVTAWNALADSKTRTSKFEYDPTTGFMSKEIIEPGDPNLCLVTTHTYDASGNRASATTRNCNGSSSEAVAPAPGTPAVIDPRTSSVSFAATAVNPVAGLFATSTSNALGHTESRQFDARFGGMTSLIGPNNLPPTTWTYDAFGRKTQETRADTTTTTWTYTFCGYTCPPNGAYFVTVTSTGAPTSSIYYDSLNRELRSETQGFDGILIRKDTEYDARRRISRVSKPYRVGEAISWTTFTSYDDLDRVVISAEPPTSSGTLTTTNEYNGLTTKVKVNSSPEQIKTTLRNARGQVATVTDPAGNTVNYTYDVFGNVVQTNAGGVIATFGYDLRGRKTSMNDPDMGAWTYTYDVLGQVVSRTDAKGQVATMVYDALGRMTSRKEPDLLSTWTYDTCTKGVGKLCSASATNSYSRSHIYDSLGRPTTLSVSIDTAYYATTTYVPSGPNVGKVDTVTYPTGFGVKNTYNAFGYLSQVLVAASDPAFPDNGKVLWQGTAQSAFGQFTNEMLGNLAQTRAFDALGRLTNTSTPIVSHAYSYDILGNLTQRVDNVQSVTENFTYDNLNRLRIASGTNSAGALVTRNFDYNAIGNVTYKSDVGTYAYPAMGAARPHAVSSVTNAAGTVTATYAYDANGNLLSGAGKAFSYTSFNMPATIVGAATYTYTYSPEHERVRLVTQLTTGTQTSIYLHPGGAGALFYEREIRSNTTENKHYVQAGSILVGVYVTKSAYAPGDGPGMRYYHRDHLGSIVAISNQAGARIETLAYEAFGKRRFPNGTADAACGILGVTTDRGFTAHEHLDELCLIHMNGRIYDPTLGRFVTADPLIQSPSNLQSYNRYSYVWNNPLNSVDPSGYSRWTRFRDKAEHALSKPLVALTVQQTIDPLLGTYLLTRSEAGKKILASEIIVGTAVATWYCGGCGVAWGALAGELNGGYSAYRAGGDILKGVAVGGALGAATAYAAGGINTETGSFWEQTGKNFAAGAIKGAGTGAAGGYAGGKGDVDDILRSAGRGALIGGSLQASKVLALGRNITYEQAVQDRLEAAEEFYGQRFPDVAIREGGALEYFRPGTWGITFGNMVNVDAGLYSDSTFDFSGLMRHEMYHVVDYAGQGFVPFIASYLVGAARFGSWLNPAEVSARGSSGCCW